MLVEIVQVFDCMVTEGVRNLDELTVMPSVWAVGDSLVGKINVYVLRFIPSLSQNARC